MKPQRVLNETEDTAHSRGPAPIGHAGSITPGRGAGPDSADSRGVSSNLLFMSILDPVHGVQKRILRDPACMKPIANADTFTPLVTFNGKF